MNRIINALYADLDADLTDFREEHVQSALTTLTARLEGELGKTYRWLAACTVAVTAGYWGGERRLRRRVKLLAMINQCRVRLGWEPVVMEDNRWASVNLYYGYGAISAYAADRGVTPEHTLILGVLDSKGPEAAVQAANILRPFTSGDHA
jgi:hypothetical protein